MNIELWHECRVCPRLQECKEPFQAEGRCQYARSIVVAVAHAQVNSPQLLHFYADDLNRDLRFASVYQKWLLGLDLSPQDFLYLRAVALAGGGADSAGEYLASAAVYLVMDILWDSLGRLHRDFVRYYGLAPDLVRDALKSAFGQAVQMSGPEVVAGSAAQGAGWGWHIEEVTRDAMWLILGLKHLDLQDLSDRAFRKTFEEEWNRLQYFVGALFDFRVVPLLSWDDLVRYQNLHYGDLVIRRSISTYTAHQAKAHPQLLTPWVKDFTWWAFGRRLREMYEPLVERVVRNAMRNMEVAWKAGRQGKTGSHDELLGEAWKQYDVAWKEFMFYWTPPGVRRPFGYMGFVGFSENPDARKTFDEVMAELGVDLTSDDFSVTPFAHYVERRLKTWVATTYPPLPRSEAATSLETPVGQFDDGGKRTLMDTVSNSTPSVFGSIYYPDVEADITGTDGQKYVLIEKAAYHFGASEDQLRRMDRIGSFKALRARDVPTNDGVLPARTRLYPISEEARSRFEVARGRAATRSSDLRGIEVSRKTAAEKLKTRVSTLRSLERSKKLVPERRGGTVIYDEALLERAEKLLKTMSDIENADSQPAHSRLPVRPQRLTGDASRPSP